MPVPGLVHRYPDRVLLLVTDRCASYCRYCTRSRVVSGAGEQELTMDLEGLSHTCRSIPRFEMSFFQAVIHFFFRIANWMQS